MRAWSAYLVGVAALTAAYILGRFVGLHWVNSGPVYNVIGGSAVAALIGPPRTYAYLAWFPEWGAHGPGLAPVLAITATNVLVGVVGHGVMRLVAGPARADRLARRPWETA